MIVRAIDSPVALHDHQVILEVVCAGVLPFAPLDNRHPITNPHDRRPIPLARVIPLGGAYAAIMTQPQRMAGLVAGGFRNILFVIRSQLRRKYPAYRVRLGGWIPVERIHVSNSAGAAAEPIEA